jgi:hypothetical protein
MRQPKTLYRLYWLRNRSVNGAMRARWFISKTKMNDRFKAKMNPMAAQCSDHSEQLKTSSFRRRAAGRLSKSGPPQSDNNVRRPWLSAATHLDFR